MHDLDAKLQALTASWQNKLLWQNKLPSREDFEKEKNKLVAEVLYSLTLTRTRTRTQTQTLTLTWP